MLRPLTPILAVLTLAGTASAQTDSTRLPQDPDVEPPVLVSVLRPAFPRELQRLGIEGHVIVEVIVDTLGRPDRRSVRIVRSTDRRLEDPAREAVVRARFRPGRFAGLPARLPYRMTIAFTIRWEELLPSGCQRVRAPEDTAAMADPPPDTIGVLEEAGLEERPERLSSPPVHYPAALRQLGVQGRVAIRAIVGRDGCIEPWSVRVVEATNPGFRLVSIAVVLASRYRPGRIHGQPVRAWVQIPVNFAISR